MKGKTVLVTGANGGLGTIRDAGLSRCRGNGRWHLSKNSILLVFKSASFCSNSPLTFQLLKAPKVLLDQVIARSERIDVLAHTVGASPGGILAETDDATFRKMFESISTVPFLHFRAAIPGMRKTGNGRIVAIGSRAAMILVPGVGAYSASKAAHGFAHQNGSCRKQGCRNNSQRHFARHDRHTGEPQGDSECRLKQVGEARQYREPGRVAGRRSRDRCERRGHPRLRQRCLRS